MHPSGKKNNGYERQVSLAGTVVALAVAALVILTTFAILG